MTVEYQILLALAVLAVIGVVASIGAGRRQARRAQKGMREATRMTGAAFRALVTAAAIVGVQYAVLTHWDEAVAVLLALSLPALFAGASLARLLAVTEVVPTSGKGAHR